MNEEKLELKLSFIPGLQGVVLDEINKYSKFSVIEKNNDSIYLDFIDDFNLVRSLRSVARAYIVIRGSKYNPMYVSNHKSLLGSLLEMVMSRNEPGAFRTFKITCAGSDSVEVNEINSYIEDTFKLSKKDESDIKIHIIKIDEIWEVGIQITPRPLSFRAYKVRNMSGAMDPTIAYSLNSMCNLEQAKTYLNVFSGSATLLIEAGLSYSNLDTLIGFDINKEHLSLSIQNIKSAELIKKITVKEANIFNNPDFGKFDVIVSDLPFGMVISKNEDLDKLYKTFIDYAEQHLNPNGVVAVYTSEFKIFEKVIESSNFIIIQSLGINLITSENQYLPTKILVLKLK
ncbi:MAG: tRNA (guanine6-N2)-methyltransferase [Parcubacteria bacterium C7867-006]|nr:MAG: tRNA (guanine6-N2)-methyltransferase [Parcubacteria bacterium C7867-006]